jgi:predicted DNA binding protein
MDCRTIYSLGKVHKLFEISTLPNLVGDVVKQLKKDPYIRDLKLLISKTGKVYGSAMVRCRGPCKLITFSGCLLKGGLSSVDGYVIWHIVGSCSSCKMMLDILKETEIKFEVLRLKKLRSDKTLTGRQAVILKTALDMGYFDYPKRITTQELANIFGITRATLSEILRRGIRNVLSHYYIRDYNMNTLLTPLPKQPSHKPSETKNE